MDCRMVMRSGWWSSSAFFLYSPSYMYASGSVTSTCTETLPGHGKVFQASSRY